MMNRLYSTEEYWIAENAYVTGDVTLGKDVSVWHGCAIRGDIGPIVIGDETNIQENSVIHAATTIGKGCTVGHGAIVHGCTIGDNTLIGMGSVVMDDAVIGSNCIVAAGALVTSRTVVPDYTLILGNPAKVMKPLDEAAAKKIRENAEEYLESYPKYR